MRLAARGAARLMAGDDGPRIATLAFDGWDTHANEGGPVGRLALLLSGSTALWRNSARLGRSMARYGGRGRYRVRAHGAHQRTAGTDHGTGTIALLVSGAVKGGRVDFPIGRGLKPANLYEGRDLAPTSDLRASNHQRRPAPITSGFPERVLAETVFPSTARRQEPDEQVGRANSTVSSDGQSKPTNPLIGFADALCFQHPLRNADAQDAFMIAQISAGRLRSRPS